MWKGLVSTTCAGRLQTWAAQTSHKTSLSWPLTCPSIQQVNESGVTGQIISLGEMFMPQEGRYLL